VVCVNRESPIQPVPLSAQFKPSNGKGKQRATRLRIDRESEHSNHSVRYGWHVPFAYVVEFFTMLILVGWHPDPSPRR
jgi:hypothetical protein